MSTAEILSLISTISYVIAAVSFVLAIFFWFYFKIPSVIGDLSGRTARKSIARMRATNEKAGGQGYKPSATNVNRGTLTDTMQHSRKLKADAKKKEASKKAEPKKKAAAEDLMPETGLLVGNRAEAPAQQETAMLDSNEATGLLVDTDATAPLVSLYQQPAKRTGGVKLTMLDDVMLIHTDEVIR